MLVQFAVENFQSIKDRVVLDMRKLNIKEHGDSLIRGECLPVSVIYGPNAGGKSTVVGALSMFISIIGIPLYLLSTPGQIRQASIPVPVPYLLDQDSRNKPTVFELVFQLNDKQYRIYMESMAGKIKYESLQEKGAKGKPATLYERTDNSLIIGNKMTGLPHKAMAIAEDIPALVYLRRLFDVSPIKELTEYIRNSYPINFGSPVAENLLQSTMGLPAADATMRKAMLKMMQYLNLDIDDFDIQFLDKEQSAFQIRAFHKMKNGTYFLPLQVESMGTQKIFNLLPCLISCLKNGTLLLVDELDAKLHPKMLERIIGLFTNKENNPNGAQLIFTSHDIATMNSDVFRRDEIWFAAKNEAESTDLYSLADIRDQDGELIRRDAVFSKQYLEGRYGADPYFKAMKRWEDK